MRVLLFGAGASFKAGYLLAKDLINEIEKEARDSNNDKMCRDQKSQRFVSASRKRLCFRLEIRTK